MKLNFIFYSSVIIFLGSCGSKQQVRAKIFERKQLSENRLLIKYQYQVEGKDYIDSSTVKNVVIPSDTIDLIVDPANPAKGLPDLSR